MTFCRDGNFLGHSHPVPKYELSSPTGAKRRDLRFSPPASDAYGSVTLPFVIPRACDFFDLFAFFAPDQMFFQSPQKRRHPERSASQIYRITEAFMARSRRTPAMLVGRCSSQLSSHRLQGNLKSHSLRAKPRDLLFVNRPLMHRERTRLPFCHSDRSEAKWRVCPERSRRGTCC